MEIVHVAASFKKESSAQYEKRMQWPQKAMHHP